ncbi:MAG: outer membrane protein assembly factor BamE [Variovorax sp.]|nr:MAG: outer membrane protein assembly factor BamE [Variovorax sp.]
MIKTKTSLAVAAATAALLAGCAGPGPSYPVTPEGHARAASEMPPAPAEQDFPAIGSAKWQQGSFASVEALRALRTGMGKDQVRNLLGGPHFSEGMFGVREWNYIFHFRTGTGPEFITCQYMVRFNGDMLTNGMYWKNPACAAMVNPAEAKPSAAMVAPPAAPRKVTLAADGLFRFDRSALADLLPEGRSRVEALAAELQRSDKKLKGIVVTGHTDRLGSASYNHALSLARANTVRDLMVRKGINGALVRAAGEGERRPVVSCEGAQATPALVACLQPNRRVDIEVSAEN